MKRGLLKRLLPVDLSSHQEKIIAYIFLIPAFFFMFAFIIYPIAQTFIVSFQDVNLLDFSRRSFVGLQNYVDLLHSSIFIRALKITVLFVLVVVPIQSGIALFISILLNHINKGKTFFRAGFFVPYVTSTVAATMVFMRLFTKNGIMSVMLTHLGFLNVTWFANMNLAFPFLAFIYIWKNFGFYTILFLNGLNTIPSQLYEAAAIDGANRFRKFRHITIPMLKPFLLLVLITGMISAFKIFDEVYVLSRGGSLGSPAGSTMTLVVYIYAQAFRYNNFGYASAASIFLLVMVWIMVVLLRRNFQEDMS